MKKQMVLRKTVAAALRVVALLSVLAWPGGARMTEAKTNAWKTSGPEAATIDPLAVDPGNPETVYAAVRAFGFAGPDIFKSTDGAGTWSDVSSDLASHSVFRMVIDPRTPTTVYVVSIGEGVFKTTDGGHTWTAASTGLPEHVFADALVIDAQNQDTLYIVSGGLFKTTDGGDSWFPVSSGLPQPTDVRAVVVDPQSPATLYASTYLSGIFKSTDGGGTWSVTSGSMKRVTAMAIDPRTPTTLYGGTWCQGLFKSFDAGVTWSGTSLIGYGMCVSSIVVDPRTPTTLYVNGSSRSTDGAVTWSRFGPSAGAGSILAIDPQAPATLYAGYGGTGVFKTTDGGGTWHTANSGLFQPPVTALAVDPSNTGTVYAGTTTSGFFKSTDGGGSWRRAGTDLSPGACSLAIDPQTPTTVYAGVGGVAKSTDGGETWNLPGPGNAPVTTLVIDPQTPATLYAGSLYHTPEGYYGGIHKTTDAGDTWSYIVSGLTDPYDHNLIIGGISRLVIDPQTPATLYANVTLRRFGSRLYKTIDDTSTLYAATTSGVFVIRQNRRPVAVAGADRVVECGGPAGIEVTLDAGGSSDTDGDDLTYVWSGAFGRIEGPRPSVRLPLGVTMITLVVSDGVEESGPDALVVDVRDTVSPTLEVTATPAILWPPDGRLVAVGFQVAASDRCDR